MEYNEKDFKISANRKTQKVWIILCVILTMSYASDTANGLYPKTAYVAFLLFCWIPIIIGRIILRLQGCYCNRLWDLLCLYRIYNRFTACIYLHPARNKYAYIIQEPWIYCAVRYI